MARLIDADKIISHLNDEIEACGNPDGNKEPISYGTMLGLISAKAFIETAETADVQEVRHGKWIKHSVDIVEHPLHCSLCGWSNYRISNREVIDFGFCPNPNCGAKMDEEEVRNG